MGRATVQAVVRSPCFRRLVSSAVATAVVLSSIAALPSGMASTCPAARSCPEAMLTDGCCHGQQSAPAAATAFAETWSRFHIQLMSWPAEMAGGQLPSLAAAAVDSRARLLVFSPPPDPHLPSVLLI
jgi:hypothetical protein